MRWNQIQRFYINAGYFDSKQGKKWARQDSNLRPSDYESPALTAAPRARFSKQVTSNQCASEKLVTDYWSLNGERETGFEPANISLEG